MTTQLIWNALPTSQHDVLQYRRVRAREGGGQPKQNNGTRSPTSMADGICNGELSPTMHENCPTPWTLAPRQPASTIYLCVFPQNAVQIAARIGSQSRKAPHVLWSLEFASNIDSDLFVRDARYAINIGWVVTVARLDQMEVDFLMGNHPQYSRKRANPSLLIMLRDTRRETGRSFASSTKLVGRTDLPP
ncbi:hypothetical protein SODALDRAFT_359649 [Sodiomyces alkalinus F11]|uniref:Uncharacterized protein n=1 Tax=Sodiomyces alkalinus (strain CBS 110278 / VKM F-3762 / F11) TaxID=1314773 RepID=A0A3N2PVM2_SODAK|nr:hypothetical protein SODALDRAFT_359649 [Sodiomyces alkalinus F11]ROT38550.1 hypothetical protein SODALDRAFT_359649 [Sodiomyces alkalinus F11]